MSEFNDLKAGDEVVLISNGLGATKYLIQKIDRVTKTQIAIGNFKYRRNDGRQIGYNKYYGDRLCMPTEAMRQKVKEYNQSLLRWHSMKDLQDTDWVSLEQLQQIQSFVNEMETAGSEDGE